MKKRIFKVLGDQSSSFKYYVIRNYIYSDKDKKYIKLYNLLNKIKYFFPKINISIKIMVFSPNSYFKFVWNLITTISLIYTSFYKTFIICFNYRTDFIFIDAIFYFIPIFIFLLDILITCNTSFY